MNRDFEEARLTAYVLGELDENESRELESQVSRSPQLQSRLEEIRSTVGLLQAQLRREPDYVLSENSRRAIEAGARGGPPADRKGSDFSWFRVARYGAYAAAACIVLMAVSVPDLLQSRGSAIRAGYPYHVATPVSRGAAESKPIAPSRYEQQKAQARAPGETRNEPVRKVEQVAEKEPPVLKGVAGRTAGILPAGAPLRSSMARTRDVRRDDDLRADVAPPDFNTEAYDRIEDNPFIRVVQDPLSTFSIDVDTASYANLRRLLDGGRLPPRDSVRIEEMINYFDYDYPQPRDEHPFSVNVEVTAAPWEPAHRLARIGLKGREIAPQKRPASNLVFLLDVSGSMQPANKLPLLKRAMRLLVDRLDERDRVAIVVYAGASGLVLPSTSCDQKEKIVESLERLRAGGSTNGGAGLELAYRTAQENFIRGGINRVILATDGDFNVGVTNQGDLTRVIEEKAGGGVFLSVLGFGMGNYKDSTLEKLADRGNGNYAYVDTIREARKVLVEQMGGTLITIAKDVKIQVEFNPAEVEAYRLLGYENRILRHQDFNDDRKDAGEIGSGHTVTVLYEVVPAGVEIELPGVDPLKYQTPAKTSPGAAGGEILTVKLRYKQPDGETSTLMQRPVIDQGAGFDRAPRDSRFAAAVAAFGMILRDSPFKGEATLDMVEDVARASVGQDRHGYRAEFLRLVERARALKELEKTNP